MKKNLKKVGQFLRRKKIGFIITMEVLATITVMTLLMMGNFYVLQAMDRQKYMYNALISAVSQASRWGGTNTTMYKTFNKNGMDIEANMKAEIKRATGLDVELELTPTVVDNNEEIHGTLVWKDVDLWLWSNENEHSISLESESIVTAGKLIKQ